MPDTQSTDGLLTIIRTRLLTFTPSGTDTRTLADRIGTYSAGGTLVSRLWFEKVPDDVAENASNVNVWGLMQLIPAKQAGDDGRFMRRGELDVRLFGRPRRAAVELSGMADVVEQALFSWVNHSGSEGGYIKALGGLTRTRIVYDDPSDRELGEIELRVNISYAPEFLTQYSS